MIGFLIVVEMPYCKIFSKIALNFYFSQIVAIAILLWSWRSTILTRKKREERRKGVSYSHKPNSRFRNFCADHIKQAKCQQKIFKQRTTGTKETKTGTILAVNT